MKNKGPKLQCLTRAISHTVLCLKIKTYFVKVSDPRTLTGKRMVAVSCELGKAYFTKLVVAADQDFSNKTSVSDL